MKCPGLPSQEFLAHQKRVQAGKGNGKGSYPRSSSVNRGKGKGWTEGPKLQSSQGLPGVQIRNSQEWRGQPHGGSGSMGALQSEDRPEKSPICRDVLGRPGRLPWVDKA